MIITECAIAGLWRAFKYTINLVVAVSAKSRGYFAMLGGTLVLGVQFPIESTDAV